jgi:hypothetical protein
VLVAFGALMVASFAVTGSTDLRRLARDSS